MGGSAVDLVLGRMLQCFVAMGRWSCVAGSAHSGARKHRTRQKTLSSPDMDEY